MLAFEKYFRAWLAFLVLQAIGSVYLLCISSKKGDDSVFPQNVTSLAHRIFALLTLFLAVVRIVLIYSFGNKPVHIIHLIITALYGAFVYIEMEIQQTMTFSVANSFSIVVNGLTFVAFLFVASAEESVETDKQDRRRGRLFAKHYMEGDILEPPKNDPYVEVLRRRR